ncbi:hypothetical protein QF030_000035 [Streptomyces rishiriensis]|uniref:Secreted protein n=1 Tax=Streptomyces rishiriensis TaxID=68264 RepID=A0ABU0NGU0_STRRH|nr:hypothetical protein [Streptomyces rishiriensis]
MNAPTLPSLLSGLAAGSSALADTPWWIMIPLLLPPSALGTTTRTGRPPPPDAYADEGPRTVCPAPGPLPPPGKLRSSRRAPARAVHRSYER